MSQSDSSQKADTPAATLADTLAETAMSDSTGTPISTVSPAAVNKEVEDEGEDFDEMDLVDAGKEHKEDVPESAKLDIKIDIKPEVKLQNLFDDGMSDGDFEGPIVPDTGSSAMNLDIDSKPSDENVMRLFYQRLFPWRQLFQWLNHSPVPTNDFAHREFAFTLSNDAYLRYQSFTTADTLKKDVLRLMPSRFEIGPVYTTNPRDRKTLRNTSAFKPLAKELCFDIDLTDYDDIRTCCDKANICNLCWQFITMAIKVVDVALREDFGFKHIMWVYSGRRGAHAWVCDKKVRAMDDSKRRAIAGYLELVKGGANSGKRVNVSRPLHPHIS